MSVDDFDGIRVKGAREHNLKNINIDIPRNKLTVITGLSGSGKSSLAFDTIYAEGQRRYVDSLSTYARYFLDKLNKPNIDSISGLSPAIAIEQKQSGLNPRSTVGTVTEIYDFLRLLFAKVGQPHCPVHNVPVRGQMPDQIISDIESMGNGSKLIVLTPIAKGRKGEFQKEFQKWLKRGFVSAKVDGRFVDLEGIGKLTKTKAHDIDIVIDKIILKAGVRSRLAESVHLALNSSGGQLSVETTDGNRKNYSLHSACPICGFNFPMIEPRFFSFNSPHGACRSCSGLGTMDHSETLDGEHEDETRLSIKVCPDCKGSRLREEARYVYIAGKCITEVASLSAEELRQVLQTSEWSTKGELIAEKILKELNLRLDYLLRVGTGYLSLDRSTRTLSGGEAQRIRLASQVASSLIGVLYVLDEPSIGLHPRDHHRLLSILEDLRDMGNTILVVEHDEDTIRAADHVIDMGPGAGILGGKVIEASSPQSLTRNKQSLTGQYLAGTLMIPVPKKRRPGSGHFLSLLGASGNNLKDVDVHFPLGTFIAVTGVSGSGKSSLIVDTLYRLLSNHFYTSNLETLPFQTVKGLEHLDKVIDINQNPIGRTPRSIPATYVGLFPLIRDLFASLPESKLRGYSPGRFSFNVKGGRCEHCGGGGLVRMEMHFLSDVFVKCDYCEGRRYNRETLAVRYRHKNINEVLNMSIEEALEFFQNHSAIKRKLQTLSQVGLDYLTLGQSSTTLSGGEAQRIKLSKELSKRSTGKTLYILDEPTTGLHFEDVRKLVELLDSLVQQENTVIVIEHNMDVVKSADYVFDLGPDGGQKGGEIVAHGPPEEIVHTRRSETARFLQAALENQSV